MKYKNCLPLPLTVFAVLLFFVPDARACSCLGKPTVLGAYEEADFVVVARAVSVEKAEAEKVVSEGRISSGEMYVAGVKSTAMRVERVYKGGLKVGDEMIFAQGGGADCIRTFSEEDVGRSFLFYVSKPSQRSRFWTAITCGRSRSVEDAGDDLLYLDKMEKVRGKTRLSGTLEYWGDGGPSLGGRLIRVVGAKKTHEVKTDVNGVYEIYDLPPGEYKVELEAPAGWKVDAYSPASIASLPTVEEAAGRKPPRSPVTIPVVIQDKRHTRLDISFEIDNSIRGRVLDAAGRPMRGVCVNAVPTRAEPKSGYHGDCTDEDGSFEMEGLEAGGYVLVANDEGRLSSSEPFPTLYFPNVFERERAGVINVGAGDHLEGFDIFVPKAEETVTVEGVLLYSDGKPVVEEGVQFKAEKVAANVAGDAHAKTDARGRFRIKILKGLEGELFGGMHTYLGKFENCPKLDALVKQSANTVSVTEVKTPAVKIRADADIFDVELRFPFPFCKKAQPGH